MEIITGISFLLMISAIILWRNRHGVSGKINGLSDEMDNSNTNGLADKSFMTKIIVLSLCVRFSIVSFFFLTDIITIFRLSKDSFRYHVTGIEIAQQISSGYYSWSAWIDDGWFQFTGLIYSIFGPHQAIIQLINVTIGSLTPLIIYLIAKRTYKIERVARFSAYLTAFFPSFIYWSILPLKEALSLFSLSLLVWCAVNLRQRYKAKYIAYLLLALLIIVSLRDYMFYVCVAFLCISLAPVAQKRVVSNLFRVMGIVLFLGSLSYVLGFGFLGIESFKSSGYFDIDFINSVREDMSQGYAPMFIEPEKARWGTDVVSNLKNFFLGIYYFFFSINPIEIGRARQLIALPEMLFILFCILPLIRGISETVQHYGSAALPIIVFGSGIMIVYVLATTNMGAMFRWRMQALPFFFILISYGAYVREKGIIFRFMKFLVRIER